MMTHKIKCLRCGREFESHRTDAKYCSGTCRTLASKERNDTKTNVNHAKATRITLKFTNEEVNLLEERVNYSGLSLAEYVKIKSLSDTFTVNKDKNTLVNLQKENKLLKAELNYHRGDRNPGIYLDVDSDTKLKIRNSLSKYFKVDNYKLEELIIYVSSEFSSIIGDILNEIKTTLKSIKK